MMKKTIFGVVGLMAMGGLALDLNSFAAPAAERHPETWFHLIGGNVAKGAKAPFNVTVFSSAYREFRHLGGGAPTHLQF